MYDILLLGNYFFDIIFSGLKEFPALGREVYSSSITSTGGAMYITATALRRLGANVGWPAIFGDDPYSQYVCDLSLKEGIDLSLARFLNEPFRRVTTSMPLHTERAFVTYIDDEPDDLYDFWLDAAQTSDYRHLHVGGIEPPEFITPIFDAARARGATVSMDCQDDPMLKSGCDWRALLSHVDIFMPNAREARLITGLESVEDAARKLGEWVPKVVVKDGANGAWVTTDVGLLHSPGISAGEVVDTTGAGDCFNAGFLFGRIVEGQPDEICAQYGNICGGLSVTGVGGATTAPTFDELTNWMARLNAVKS
jgi:sugar/nucleoside kinase (ribokinase family)